jgi:hypothetical protein
MAAKLTISSEEQEGLLVQVTHSASIIPSLIIIKVVEEEMVAPAIPIPTRPIMVKVAIQHLRFIRMTAIMESKKEAFSKIIFSRIKNNNKGNDLGDIKGNTLVMLRWKKIFWIC